MAWYPAANKSVKGNSGGSYTGGPFRTVLHTTEGSSASGAISAFKSNNSWPHFLIDYVGSVWQFVDTGVAARALRNLSGGVQTNRESAIQIEIVGFAGKPNEHPINQIDSVKNLMRWIESTHGVQAKGPGRPFATAYGQNHLRFTNSEWDVFNGTCGHCHVPENCVHVDTPILTVGLDWVPAGSLQIGDELFGFDEELVEVGSTGGRRFRRSQVEGNHVFEAEGYTVATAYGEVITTANHPWMVKIINRSHGKRIEWVTTVNLDPANHELYFSSSPWEGDKSHSAGWLAGVLDADGHTQSNRNAGAWVGFGQVRGPLLDCFKLEMESRGFILKQYDRPLDRGYGGKKPFSDVRVTGGLWEQLRVLGILKPHRLNLDVAWNGAVVGKTCKRVKILSITPCGVQQFAGLQTSTQTYIANGFLVHNSHWDPGAIDLASLLPAPGFQVPASYYTEVANVPFTVTRPQGGYIVVGGDGGVFAYDAPFFGSLGGVAINAPVIGALWTPTGQGYWLLGADGAIFSYGDAVYKGGFNALDAATRGDRKPIGVVTSGNGYKIIALDPSNDGSPFDYYAFE